jgi:hypothetical protein
MYNEYNFPYGGKNRKTEKNKIKTYFIWKKLQKMQENL